MSPPRVFSEQACAFVRSTKAKLVAIDGLPCSGKSTLAAHLVSDFGFQSVPLDDFFLPQSDWPSTISPSFPFLFYRYPVFLAAVEELASRGSCEYLPFDWDEMKISKRARKVDLDAGPVVVEGTSALHHEIASLYDARLFVESHEPTTLQAILERDGGYFVKEWRTLWLPSIAVYMKSNPRERADLLVRGRNTKARSPCRT